MHHVLWLVCRILHKTPLIKLVPDKVYLSIRFREFVGKKLNWTNPKTFNEKLQWLKVYDRKPEYTIMVDKYAVKEWTAQIIGAEYVIPTLGIWENVEDIDFSVLPDQFVLKVTHNSGGLVICKDKNLLDIDEAKSKLNKNLKQNYYYAGREWPYKHVPPRIIAEQYMEDNDNEGVLTDYKFMCFSGKVECIFTCTERYSPEGLKVTFFDTKWNRLPFTRKYPSSKKIIDRPQNLEKMIELAERLSMGIPFVRVDFYEIKGRTYFGEMTFFPGNGFERFYPEFWDQKLGNLIILPRIIK